MILPHNFCVGAVHQCTNNNLSLKVIMNTNHSWSWDAHNFDCLYLDENGEYQLGWISIDDWPMKSIAIRDKKDTNLYLPITFDELFVVTRDDYATLSNVCVGYNRGYMIMALEYMCSCTINI